MQGNRQASGAERKTFGQRFHAFAHPNLDWPQPINPAVLEHERKRADARQNRAADAITAFSGSMLFVYVHVVWFTCWIGFGVEKYPYGLLTMIVSLEAIFLSTFVLISQNRADAKRQVIANEQWKTVREEDKQNVELLKDLEPDPVAHPGGAGHGERLQRSGRARRARERGARPPVLRLETAGMTYSQVVCGVRRIRENLRKTRLRPRSGEALPCRPSQQTSKAPPSAR